MMLRFEVHLRPTVGGAGLQAVATVGPGITLLDGPSGAGKSTLLTLLAGGSLPHGGSVRWGQEIWSEDGRIRTPAQERGVGWLPQAPSLVPHWTVARHLAATARYRTQDSALAVDAVAVLGLASLLQREAATLSAGEAQRVALLRALLACRGLLLLDEPVSALDPASARAALGLIAAWVAERGWTAIVVSHQPLGDLPINAHLRMEEGRLVPA